MKTTIETLTSARQISKDHRTYVEDCNATVMRDDVYFYATKHDYDFGDVRRKTFNAIWNYLYQQ
jgi:hypothetical protein